MHWFFHSNRFRLKFNKTDLKHLSPKIALLPKIRATIFFTANEIGYVIRIASQRIGMNASFCFVSFIYSFRTIKKGHRNEFSEFCWPKNYWIVNFFKKKPLSLNWPHWKLYTLISPKISSQNLRQCAEEEEPTTERKRDSIHDKTKHQQQQQQNQRKTRRKRKRKMMGTKKLANTFSMIRLSEYMRKTYSIWK